MGLVGLSVGLSRPRRRLPVSGSARIPQTGDIIASDDFNRADGALGTTPVGGKVWEDGQVQSNQMYLPNTNAPIDFGTPNIDLSFKLVMNAVPGFAIIARQASGVGLVVLHSTNNFQLYYAGNADNEAQSTTVLPVGTYTIRLVANGQYAAVYVDGGLRMSRTFVNPIGMSSRVVFQDTSSGKVNRFDDLVVRVP